MKIGYARVSTDEQSLSLQMDALARAGCDVIYSDKGVSGSQFARPGLDAALSSVSPGDSLVVWRLDRLGRSLAKLVELVSWLGKKDVNFYSLTEAINTKSAGGNLMFHMMAALSEFERSLISERTRAGMAAAKARGRPLGRKPALNVTQREHALLLLRTCSVSEVAQKYNVHPRTVKRIRDAALVGAGDGQI